MLDQLARTVNLRDLGGAIAADGRRVRRGIVYRSAALADLAGDDLAALRGIGLRAIVDLRHNAERAAHPTPWQALGCPTYWARDHHDSGADLGRRLAQPALTAADSRAAMHDLYAALPYAQAESYRRLFGAVIAGETPVLFHCAVGKDRTGVAAALILDAVGVPRDAILADYLRTAAFNLANSPHARGRPAMPEARAGILAPLLRAEADYLHAMFDAVTARSGSVGIYLRETLGLAAEERRVFADAMLEPA